MNDSRINKWKEWERNMGQWRECTEGMKEKKGQGNYFNMKKEGGEKAEGDERW